MSPNSNEIPLSQEEKSECPVIDVSVIGFPKESDEKVRVVSYEEALTEIGEIN